VCAFLCKRLKFEKVMDVSERRYHCIIPRLLTVSGIISCRIRKYGIFSGEKRANAFPFLNILKIENGGLQMLANVNYLKQ